MPAPGRRGGVRARYNIAQKEEHGLKSSMRYVRVVGGPISRAVMIGGRLWGAPGPLWRLAALACHAGRPIRFGSIQASTMPRSGQRKSGRAARSGGVVGDVMAIIDPVRAGDALAMSVWTAMRSRYHWRMAH